MFSNLTKDQKTGAIFVTLSVLLIFLWVPLDVDTGYIEKVRRQVSIGDSLAPTVAGAFLLIGGLGLLFFSKTSSETEEPTDTLAVRFALLLFAVYLIAFLTMWAVGPMAVYLSNLVTGSDNEYRLLRDTAPWKYFGFAVGGTFAVTTTISILEGKFSIKSLFCGTIAVLAMIAVYDLPFDDLLLPPNGDF